MLAANEKTASAIAEGSGHRILELDVERTRRTVGSNSAASAATTTAPMTRLVGSLGWLAPESDLARRCYYAAELPGLRLPSVDPGLETEFEHFTPLTLPDNVVQVLARSLRSMLPCVQPPYGHLCKRRRTLAS